MLLTGIEPLCSANGESGPRFTLLSMLKHLATGVAWAFAYDPVHIPLCSEATPSSRLCLLTPHCYSAIASDPSEAELKRLIAAQF